MGNKFDKKDLIGMAAMFGLASLLVVKLVPNFMEQPTKATQTPPKIEQPVEEANAETAPTPDQPDLPQMAMAEITLPEPPPMEVAKDLQPDPAEEIPVKTSAMETRPPKPAPQPAPQPVKTITPLQVVEEEVKVADVKPVKTEVTPAPQPRPAPIKVAALKATDDPVQPVSKPAKPVQQPIQPVEETRPVVKTTDSLPNPKTPRRPMQVIEPELEADDLEVFHTQPVKAVEDNIVADSMAARATVTASIKNRQTVQTGRSLLKVLEHGKGPAIQIIWPDSAAGREKLYAHLSQCYGMVSAVLTQSRFYKAGQAGPWDLNPDLYSGFLRQPNGSLPEEERFQLRQIQSQNNLGGNMPPVRLFPRQSDAILLGGLQQLIGPDYLKASNIQGRYVLENGELRLEDIHVDGLGVTGNIFFTPLNKSCGGWA